MHSTCRCSFAPPGIVLNTLDGKYKGERGQQADSQPRPRPLPRPLPLPLPLPPAAAAAQKQKSFRQGPCRALQHMGSCLSRVVLQQRNYLVAPGVLA